MRTKMSFALVVVLVVGSMITPAAAVGDGFFDNIRFEDIAEDFLDARRDAQEEARDTQNRIAREQARTRLHLLEEQEEARVRTQREAQKAALEAAEDERQAELDVYEKYADKQIELGNVPPTFREWRANRQGVRLRAESKSAHKAPRPVSTPRVTQERVSQPRTATPPAAQRPPKRVARTPQRRETSGGQTAESQRRMNKKFIRNGREFWVRGHDVFVRVSNDLGGGTWRKIGKIHRR